jgi:hypothetical protein
MIRLCTKCRKRKLNVIPAVGGYNVWCAVCLSAAGRARYKENVETERMRSRVYRQENPETETARNLAYHKAHREDEAAYRKTIVSRHARLLHRHNKTLVAQGCMGVPMSLAEHQTKLYFKNGRARVCFYCGGENNKMGVGLDRLSNCVTYSVANTVPCCADCNNWRNRRHTWQETRKYFKPQRDAAKLARRKQ